MREAQTHHQLPPAWYLRRRPAPPPAACSQELRWHGGEDPGAPSWLRRRLRSEDKGGGSKDDKGGGDGKDGGGKGGGDEGGGNKGKAGAPPPCPTLWALAKDMPDLRTLVGFRGNHSCRRGCAGWGSCYCGLCDRRA